MKKYQIIYADPPWDYADKGCQGTVANHYPTLPLARLRELRVKDIADKDCILFLWATYPFLKEALDLIEAWGFNYRTIAFQWVKLNKNNMGAFYGLGRWTRGNTEPCLLATKGKPHRISESVFQLVMTPISRHSQKPSEVRQRILELCGDLPRIELFARRKVEGWDCWGNEVEGDIVL